jgi:hypothetical protein
MSVKAINWAFEQQLTPTEKVLLLALADHANDDGVCFPGHKRLERKCSLSRSTIKRGIRSLKSKGLLVIEERTDKSGRQTSNVYTLDLTKVVEGEGATVNPRGVKTESVGEGATYDPVEGVTGDPVEGASVDPEGVTAMTHHEPSFNHHKEVTKKNGDLGVTIFPVPTGKKIGVGDIDIDKLMAGYDEEAYKQAYDSIPDEEKYKGMTPEEIEGDKVYGQWLDLEEQGKTAPPEVLIRASAYMWKTYMKDQFPYAAFGIEATGKARKQFKTLIEKLGNRAPDLIMTIILRWDQFVVYCREQEGTMWKDPIPAPHLGFALENAELIELFDLYQNHTAKNDLNPGWGKSNLYYKKQAEIAQAKKQYA